MVLQLELRWSVGTQEPEGGRRRARLQQRRAPRLFRASCGHCTASTAATAAPGIVTEVAARAQSAPGNT